VEQWAARVGKAGAVVVQRRAREDQDPPHLFVMTETAWRRLIGGAAMGQSEVEARVASADPRGAVEPEREKVPRPTPEVVRAVARALEGERLLLPALVQALRDQTGCSRAGAYRAVVDALAAGRIR